jgi:hypothetical protein
VGGEGGEGGIDDLCLALFGGAPVPTVDARGADLVYCD